MRRLPDVVVVSLVSAVTACGPTEGARVLYPQESEAAQHLFDVAFVQQITLADNFVMRPDEFAGVAVDPDREFVYVGSRDGSLLALDERGEVVWSMALGGAISAVPLLTRWPQQNDDELPSMLLVGTDNGELIAIDVDERKIQWRYETDGKIRNPAVVVEGIVYFVNSREQVYALDARTGEWRWQYQQDLSTDFTVHGHAGLTFVPPGDGLDASGMIVSCFDSGRVAALGALTGEALWLATVAPDEGGDFVDCDSTPLVEDGRVVVAGQSTGVYSFALADGALQWTYPVRASSSIVHGRGGDYVGASSLDGLYALDAQGQLRWRTEVDPGVLSTPVVVDDVVFLTHSESGLLAFDAETGSLLAHIELGSGMSSSPVFDPVRRQLFATTNRGTLLALSLVAAE